VSECRGYENPESGYGFFSLIVAKLAFAEQTIREHVFRQTSFVNWRDISGALIGQLEKWIIWPATGWEGHVKIVLGFYY